MAYPKSAIFRWSIYKRAMGTMVNAHSGDKFVDSILMDVGDVLIAP
jgi:hypothetical protein